MKIENYVKLIIASMLFVTSILFWYAETNYFGWNKYPQSQMEAICDGIAIVVGVISMVKIIKYSGI